MGIVEYIKTKNWCSRLGAKNVHWVPLLTLYNNGYKLFGVRGVDPRQDLVKKVVNWKWLMFKQWNPFFWPHEANYLEGIRVCHWGHDGAGTVKVEVDCGERFYISIPRAHCLQMVESMGGPEFFIQYQPIPYRVFSGLVDATLAQAH